jgi:glycosyltransferase involved in cell wall biosynthesis
MKVVHLNASDKGGASIVAQRLNSALNEYTQVSSQHLIFEGNTTNLSNTHYWGNSPVKKIWAKLNHALDKFDFLQYEREAKIRFQFNHARIGVDISKHPLVVEADIIHIHWILKGFLSFDSLEKLLELGKPVVWTCHDLWPFTGGCFHKRLCMELNKGCGNCLYLRNSEPNDASRFWLKEKTEIFNKHNLYWVSPSDWVINEVRGSSVFCKNPKIKQINNPIKVFSSKILDSELKEIERIKLGLQPKKFTLLFSAANIDNPSKGFDDFMKIIDFLPKQFLQAVIVGASQNKIELPISFISTGYISDEIRIQKLISVVDLFITPSLEETFGMVVAESLSNGIPALSYNIGALPELISHGETGFVYPKGDWQSMAQGVKNLMENPDLLKAFSFNARKKAEEQYDESQVAQQYAALYQKALNTF